MRPSPVVAALAILVGLLGGCGEDETAPAIKPVVESSAADQDGAERVAAFVAAPTYSGLVELLHQPHARARELIGPHHLHYQASFYTGPDPAEVPLDAPVPDVAMDEPIIERFVIEDELDLRWVAATNTAVHFSLAQQGGEPGSGRDLIVIGERAWAQVDGRGWFERELDGDLWTLWLDDAQHAVVDVVEFAGPSLQLGPVESVDHLGRPAVRISLSRSSTQHPERIVEAPQPWRSGASIKTISGEVVVDRATGLWLSAKLEVGWQFQDSARRDVLGRVRLDATFEPLPDTDEQRAAIGPPEGASPILERDRPQLLRDRLLDGLAGPGSGAL